MIILGTNADDDITVIARDFQATDNPSFPGTDGIRDFKGSYDEYLVAHADSRSVKVA